ncbi:MAG TPA: RHS repeat-associated core domain-containing protein [Streptosporangiaceae bacterium]|nr:RHS repeat-associated core domain-containing protein [Streptosporangiaceae bacterium]
MVWKLRSGVAVRGVRGRAVRRWLGRVVACGTAVVMVPALAGMTVPPPGPRSGPAVPLRLPDMRPVPAYAVHHPPARVPAVAEWHAPPLVWPAAGAAMVVLRAGGPAGQPGAAARGVAGAGTLAAPSPGSVRAGSLPVWVGPAGAAARGGSAAVAPAQARVVMASRRVAAALGVSGVVFSVAGRGSAAGLGSAAGMGTAVHVSLGYRGFAYADGGGFAARLVLVSLPACALTTPRIPVCRRTTPLGSANDLRHDLLGADVNLPGGGHPVVLAASTSPSGSAGDYSATPLSEAGTWAAGGSSGAFTYSYPVNLPPVPGGLAPDVTLDYSSQMVDGLTSSSNNQASWVGDGWDYQPGFIERDYQSCGLNPAGPTKTGDLCWSSNDTTTLSLGGTTTILVHDSSTGWHAEADNGEQITYKTGGHNGTHDGGYWVVTDPNGTSYYFGLNQLPGYSSVDTPANSAWTVPVYATSSGQPCYNSDFSKSHCDQAWKWNLDYVTDSHGDAESFSYNTETNYYSSDSTASDPNTTANASYIQGGALSKIDYGLRAGAVYGVTPAAEVKFTAPEDRTDIPTSSTYGGDLACASGATCQVASPTFWSKYDLTTIETKSLVGTSLQPVDSWSLDKKYPDPHDTTSTPSLWLSSITRTGEDGSPQLPLPPLSFVPEPLANRVETAADLHDGYSIVTRMRMYEVISETGGKTTVTYDTPPSSCTSGNFPAEDKNSTLCYPDWWTPPLNNSPIEDWFNKYVVSNVSQSDSAGGNTPVVTNYTYGEAAWHYNDDALSRSKYRTWDQWRGFETVTTEVGDGTSQNPLTGKPDPVTQSTGTYFQGMDGDYQSGGGTSSASLTSTLGNETITDSPQFAGDLFEHIVDNGVGGGVVTDAVTVPWSSAATADQNQPSPLPDLKAFMTGTAQTKTFTTLAAGGYREADDTFTHDSNGRVTVAANVPDTSDSSEDTCAQTSYAAPTSGNPDSYLTDLPSQVTVTSVAPSACPVSGAPTKQELVSDTKTFYDGSTTLGAVPGAGDVTMTQRATSYSGTAEVFTTESKATYDEYGRTLTSTNADNNTAKTSYTPSTGAEPTSLTDTDAMGLATKTTYDPARDLPLTVTNPDNVTTNATYDALGRITAGWLPGQFAAGKPANKTFSYDLSATSPSVVTTNTLNSSGSYLSSDTLYDSLARVIETQTKTTDGTGMDVSDTFYNSDGQPVIDSNPYYVQFNPNAQPPVTFGTLISAPSGAVPSQTQYAYDGDGRVTIKGSVSLGHLAYETNTTYGGDYTTVTPPQGGTAQTTYTNGIGKTSYIYQYHSATPPASPPAPGTGPQAGPNGWDATSYTYTPAGQLATVQDTTGNQWSYGYDLAGDQTTTTDPDSGTTANTYDLAGNLLTVTDARNDQVSYTYDADSRKTFEYNTTGGAAETSSDELAAWVYDTLSPGLLTSATSYGPGGTSGTAYTDSVLGYYSTGLPKGNAVAISAGPLAGSYSQSYSYDPLTQQETQYLDSAAGGLPRELVTLGADNANRPASVSGLSVYGLLGYDELGRPYQYTMGSNASPVHVIDTYDQLTGLPKTSETQTGTGTATIAATTYGYDNAGLVTSESDMPTNGPTQVQCFSYDYLERLTTAWSQGTSGCSGGPSQQAESGAAAPYWGAYQYDTRNDLTQVTSTPPAGAATTSTNSFPPAGSAQPHGVSSVQVSGPGGSSTSNYGYNAAGETTSISGPSSTQTLAWNDTGKLASVTASGPSGGKTSYVYDANGGLLLQENPGSTTLFLPDEQLTENTLTQAVTGTRYYSLGSVTIGALTGGQLSYLTGNTQGTDTIAVNSSNLTPTYRYYDPYGNPVGTAPSSWPGERGFVGGTADPVTGFTNLGAREYNPATASFLSPDPLVNPDDPQDLNAYAYASDSPATNSDPSGAYINTGSCIGSIQYCSAHSGGGGGGSRGRTSTPTQTDPYPVTNNPTPYYSTDEMYWWGKLNAITPPPAAPPIQRVVRQVTAQQKSTGLPTCTMGVGSRFQSGPCTPAPMPKGGGGSGGGCWIFSWACHEVAAHWRGLAQIGIGTVAVVGGVACVATVACAVVGGAVGLGAAGSAIAGSAVIGAAAGAGSYAVSGGQHTLRGYVANAGLGAAAMALGGAWGLAAKGFGLSYAAAGLGGMGLGASFNAQVYNSSTPPADRTLGGFLSAVAIGGLEASPLSPRLFGWDG